MTNTAQEIVKEVSDGLVVTLTVGAAREVIGGDIEKLVRFQERVSPMVDVYQNTGDVTFLLDAIQDTMGPEWKPTGEWVEYIEAVKGLTAGLAGK